MITMGFIKFLIGEPPLTC